MAAEGNQCQYEDDVDGRCTKCATWGFKRGELTRCKDHKDEGMKTKSRLCHCGNGTPQYNYEGNKAEYCRKCPDYTDTMVNIIYILRYKRKQPNRIRYNMELLNKFVIRDNARIDIDITNKLNKRSIIKFNCNCGETYSKNFGAIYRTGMFCKKCTNTNTRLKREKTIFEKFGVKYPSQSEEIKEKMKKTNLEKYGVEHALQSEEIKEKRKKNNLEKYRVEYPSQLEEIKEKMKKTNLEKYGVEYTSQLEEIKEKIKKTNLEKYGVEHTLQSKEIRDRAKKTILKKYGVEYPSQSEEIKEKMKKTNLEKYGVKNVFQSEEIKEKMKKTNLEKYRVEYPSQSEEIKEKIKKTYLEKYGVENPLQLEEIKEKIKKTNLEKYGVENPLQSEEIKEKIKKTNLEKYGVEYAMQHPDVFNKVMKSLYSTKEYIMPSGDTRYIQGYEPFALDELIKEYDETDIITDNSVMPKIEYIMEEKTHTYYPDIYIKSINKIIEVKSTYTYEKDLVRNLEKRSATIKNGFKFEFWIYDGNGIKEII